MLSSKCTPLVRWLARASHMDGPKVRGSTLHWWKWRREEETNIFNRRGEEETVFEQSGIYCAWRLRIIVLITQRCKVIVFTITDVCSAIWCWLSDPSAHCLLHLIFLIASTASIGVLPVSFLTGLFEWVPDGATQFYKGTFSCCFNIFLLFCIFITFASLMLEQMNQYGTCIFYLTFSS